MLTLFDYLRQRAFEAVIDGTQDAVEFLEKQQRFDQSELTENSRGQTRQATLGDQRAVDGSDAADRTGAKETKSGKQQDETLPAPRRRGRPRKNPPSNQ